MPVTRTDRVKIETLVESSRKYIQGELEKVNIMGKASTISAGEAQMLPKDLHDNWARLKQGNKAVPVKALVDAFVSDVSKSARKADRDGDGFLTAEEGKKLPAHVRDNFLGYLSAHAPKPPAKVKDATAKSRIAAHEKAYGAGKVSYAEAFKKGIAAVLRDEGSSETPRALLRSFSEDEGQPLSDAQLDAKLKRLLEGMELLPVGEASESGGDPKTDWIFAVDIDVGSDHGFWVSVDRNSGEAQVAGFN